MNVPDTVMALRFTVYVFWQTEKMQSFAFSLENAHSLNCYTDNVSNHFHSDGLYSFKLYIFSCETQTKHSELIHLQVTHDVSYFALNKAFTAMQT